MEFPYEKGKGILSYLYRKNGGNIDLYLNYDESFPSVEDTPVKTLFDDDLATYWIVGNEAPFDNYIYFCLKNYIVKITHYELYTPI